MTIVLSKDDIINALKRYVMESGMPLCKLGNISFHGLDHDAEEDIFLVTTIEFEVVKGAC